MPLLNYENVSNGSIIDENPWSKHTHKNSVIWATIALKPVTFNI